MSCLVVFGPVEECQPIAELMGEGWMFGLFMGEAEAIAPVPDFVAFSDEWLARYVRELMLNNLSKVHECRCHNALAPLFADVVKQWPEVAPILAEIWPEHVA